MTAAEINRATFAAFLTRCIGHGWAQAIDAEHGLRIHNVATYDNGNVAVEFEGGHAVTMTMDFTHRVPRCVPKTSKGKHAPCNTSA